MKTYLIIVSVFAICAAIVKLISDAEAQAIEELEEDF